MEGTVKWFNTRKGYGFIKGDDGEEYFVHHTGIEKGTFLRENDRVSFDTAQTERGKQAQKVVLLEKGSEIKKEEAPKEVEENKEVSEEPKEE